MWRVEFCSTLFAPYLPETSQVAPGVHGFELAQGLSQGLASRKVFTSYPQHGEDWGWYLEYVDQGLAVMIGCTSLRPPARDGWAIFIQPSFSLAQTADGGSRAEALSAFLAGHIEALLQEAGIAYELA